MFIGALTGAESVLALGEKRALGSLSMNGKHDGEGGAGASAALDVNRAAVALNNALSD